MEKLTSWLYLFLEGKNKTTYYSVWSLTGLCVLFQASSQCLFGFFSK